MIDRIEELLKVADPEGENYKKLLKIAERYENSVFPSYADIMFVNEMNELVDNIECEHVRHDGMCLVKNKDCDHKKRYKKCYLYDPVKPNVKGRPLKDVGF